VCTRILYKTGAGGYITGRSFDWMEDTGSDLWTFPRGMARSGGVGPDSLTWTAKYGSVVTTMYDVASVDGINEAGLVGNVLYLGEANYGTAERAGQPGLSIGAWVQYVVDTCATVAEVVAALAPDEIRIVAPTLPNGDAAVGHLAVADPTGDSAIFEYLAGKLVIHHGPAYTVMTNSPPYDEQLAINAYWDSIGWSFLPGTSRASDRFARVSYLLNASPHFDDPQMAVASVFSNMRAISVPLGLNDPKEPNIASTIWRTIADSAARRYYFDSAMSPYVFWVDLDQVDLSPAAGPRRLSLKGHPMLGGDQSAAFEPAEPFAWLS
jgi:penicillin V acylase-like amidase (Ntn superfamily)